MSAAQPTPNDATPAPTPRADKAEAKRKHSRHTVEIAVEVHELGEGDLPVRDWVCKTNDLSRGGMGLASDRMVHIGRVLLMLVPDAAGRKKVMCGIVRSTSYEAGHGYQLGVEFTALPESRALLNWRRDRGLLPAA